MSAEKKVTGELDEARIDHADPRLVAEDQFRQLRERVGVIERELVRSATSEVVDDVLTEELKLDVRRLRDEAGRLREQLRVSEDCVVVLERQLGELKAQHEELKAKCTPPSAVIAFASCTRHSPEAIPVRDFIRSLAPKRQTRAEAVADELMQVSVACQRAEQGCAMSTPNEAENRLAEKLVRDFLGQPATANSWRWQAQVIAIALAIYREKLLGDPATVLDAAAKLIASGKMRPLMDALAREKAWKP